MGKVVDMDLCVVSVDCLRAVNASMLATAVVAHCKVLFCVMTEIAAEIVLNR